jgi:glycosyltransferase involved in cell wall biosynthesis
MSEPALTVVIPTLNRPSLLRMAVASALDQRRADLEVIVIDDGSTPAVQRDLEMPDGRITVIRHDAPRGMAAARNTGIDLARGAWIGFLDDDDVWAPHKVRLLLSAAAQTAADFGYSAGLAVSPWSRFATRLPAPPAQDLHRQLLRRNVMPAGASNVVVRTALVRALGGFDETLPHFADWDMWIRLAARGRAAAVASELVLHRYHAGSRSAQADRGLRDDFDALAERYASARQASGVELDRASFERFLAAARRHRGQPLAASAAYLRAAVRLRDPRALARAVGSLLGEPGMVVAARGRPARPPAWALPYVR